MKLEGSYLFEASVAEVWSALFDPVILAAVMPGCEKLELVDGQYVGELKIKVGPVQGKFTGKVDLLDQQEPTSYRMNVDGRGAPGFVKASAAVRLEPEGDATRIHYDADAQIGGKLASVGQRLLEASARAIVAQSLDGLHQNIKLRAAAYREAAAKQAPAPATEAAKQAPVTEAATQAPVAEVAEPSVPAPPAESATPVAPAAPAAPAAAVASPAPPVVAVVPAETARAAVAFTPVKIQPSALAKSVAKEVASTMFPRSVLVVIIALQAAVIAWLLLRG
jgi:uncharacterized protein